MNDDQGEEGVSRWGHKYTGWRHGRPEFLARLCPSHVTLGLSLPICTVVFWKRSSKILSGSNILCLQEVPAKLQLQEAFSATG